jgi:hypothetical protein
MVASSNQQQHQDDDDDDKEEEVDSQVVVPSNVYVWQAQRDHLEQRMQELVQENQRLTSQVDVDLEEKVNELEQQVEVLEQERQVEQGIHDRELCDWKDRAQRYGQKVKALQTQVGRQEETRDSYRTELARRIEVLEVENVELRGYRDNREKERKHERNLHELSLKALQAKLEGQLLSQGGPQDSSRGDQLLSSRGIILSSHQKDNNTVATEDTFCSKEDSYSSSSVEVPPPRAKVVASDDAANTTSLLLFKERIRHLELQVDDARQKEQVWNRRLAVMSSKAERAQNNAEEAQRHAEVLQTYLDPPIGNGPVSSMHERLEEVKLPATY